MSRLTWITAFWVVVGLINPLFAQTFFQTIKGKVFDMESGVSLPGATIVVENTSPRKNAVTKLNTEMHYRECLISN